MADYCTNGEIKTEKVLFVKKEKKNYIKHPDQIHQICPLLYSEHKEADHRKASHVKYVSDNNNNNNNNNKSSSVTIVADNTDTYMLLVGIARFCCSIIHFCQGTSLSKAFITYHNVSAASK